MPALIANLWTPDIWIQQIRERAATYPALISLPIVISSDLFNQIASGPGVSANLPYYKDITDQADAIQVESTAPSMQNITAGRQVSPILNREIGNDATGLAAQVSGASPDPAGEFQQQLATRRQKQRQTTLINILRGVFGFSTAPAGAGAMSAVRSDYFSETGANPAASLLIDQNKFIDSVALMGENADTISGGILMHPNIRAALLKQDQISFEQYSNQEGIRLETYKGLRVFISANLRRAGGVSGFVYDTYVFTPGVVAWGEKVQTGGTPADPKIDVASLNYVANAQTNIEGIIDRSRFMLHVNGTRWGGTPAGQSATNAELATVGNWTLDYASADRVGIICVRSNG